VEFSPGVSLVGRLPAHSLKHRRKVLPYKNPGDLDLVIEGLRKSGIEE
jgi:adenylate cyclase